VESITDITAQESLHIVDGPCVVRCRVTSNVVFDRETRANYHLTVVCSDLGTPSLSSQSVIRVTITDDNDVTPTFDRKLYQTTIVENNHVGDAILQVR